MGHRGSRERRAEAPVGCGRDGDCSSFVARTIGIVRGRAHRSRAQAASALELHQANTCCGGSRAGAISSGSVGRPTWARMRRIVTPSPNVDDAAAASMWRREPQRGHFKTSFANTLCIRSAQLNFGPCAGWSGAVPETPSPRGRDDRKPANEGQRIEDEAARAVAPGAAQVPDHFAVLAQHESAHRQRRACDPLPTPR
jgi:hypothetical protein